MTNELDRVLLARDVYPSWKRRVKAATHSVRVFSPYFDRALDRLVQNTDLESSDISVVTDLSPESGALDYRAQLIGARALLRRGIEVRSLPRLHAKVLVCDGELVTIGSQNFTSFGRGSRETTVVMPDDVSDSDLARTLEEWYRSATPVSLEFIEALLADLAEPIRAVQQAQQALAIGFDDKWSAYLALLAEEDRRRRAAAKHKAFAAQLATAVASTTLRQARERVWAKLTLVGDRDYFWSLVPDGKSTFSAWRTRDAAGQVTTTRLQWLNLYPMILSPSGRMAFGRVASTRISYVRTSAKWGRARAVLGGDYLLTVRFPNSNVERSNVQLVLNVAGQPEYVSLQLDFRFDGLEANLVDWTLVESRTAGLGRSYVDSQKTHLSEVIARLDDPEALAELMHNAFATFTFSELGVRNKNAEQFFPQGWVRVALIDYADASVLVVTPDAT